MIKASFQAGVALIYDADDWYQLRTKYRIVGEYFGITKTSQIALPIALSPEQIYLLTKKGIILLVEWNKLISEPTNEDKSNFDNEITQCFEEQKIILREERRNQVELYIDQIIKGKQKDISRENIIQEELNKLPTLQLDNIITPIYTTHPDYLKGNFNEVSISNVLQYTDRVKCLVYEDLWEKKYFITVGRKFGGDFLVYLGDPVLFHAIYIVKCVENNDGLRNVTEIVALGRLGHSVKKKFVLASVNAQDRVSYITIDWYDTE